MSCNWDPSGDYKRLGVALIPITTHNTLKPKKKLLDVILLMRFIPSPSCFVVTF